MDIRVQNAAQGIQIATQSQIPLLLPFAKITLAIAVRAEEHWEQAIQLLQEVLAGELSPEAAARVKAELCATYALASRWEDAVIYALQLPKARIHPLMLVERHIELEVEALLRANHRQEAEQLIEQFSRTAGDSPRHQAHLEQSRQRYNMRSGGYS